MLDGCAAPSDGISTQGDTTMPFQREQEEEEEEEEEEEGAEVQWDFWNHCCQLSEHCSATPHRQA